MKSSISVVVFLLFICNAFVFSQTDNGLVFGGVKNETFHDIISTQNGFVIAGATKSYGEGGNDILLLEISNLGQVSKISTFGRKHDDLSRAILQSDNKYYLLGDAWDLGHSLLDAHLTCFDTYGELLWEKQFGSNNRDNGFDFIRHQNFLYLLIYSRGYDPAGDAVLIKTDLSGNIIWSKNYGTDYDDYCFDLKIVDDDKLLMTGTEKGFYNDVYANYFNSHDAQIWLNMTDTSGNIVFSKTYGGDSHDFAQQSLINDNFIYTVGSTQSYGMGSFDMFLMKTDISGNQMWLKTYGDVDYDYGMSICKNPTNDFCLFGTMKNPERNMPEFFLVKTDTSGNEIWRLTVESEDKLFGKKVISLPDGSVVIAGDIVEKENPNGSDILIMKVSSEGVIQQLINNIDSNYLNRFTLYPNPTSGNVKLKSPQSFVLEDLEINFYTIDGREFGTTKVNQPNYQFDTWNFPSGVYIYRIINPKNSELISTGKLIVR